MSTSKLNFWLDGIIGVAFVLAMVSGLMARPVHGKIEFHIFTSVVMVVGVAVHLLLHRKWIAAALRPGQKPGSLTINTWLNVLLGVSCALTLISGLGGHRAFGNDPLHVSAAISMTIILLVHLAYHWRWVVTTARRYGVKHGHDHLTGG
jgi:hypothetical protein